MRVARPRPQTLRPTRIPPEYVSPGLYKRIQFVTYLTQLVMRPCAEKNALLTLIYGSLVAKMGRRPGSSSGPPAVTAAAVAAATRAAVAAAAAIV